MVGGVVVSAYAIPDPWRKRAVVGFSFLGLLNLALIILTYENTPDVPHFADLGPFIWRGSITIWARIVAVAENHILQTVAAAAAGVVLGSASHFGYQKWQARRATSVPDNRPWLTSYRIFDLADQGLVKTARNAKDKSAEFERELEVLQIQRENLRPKDAFKAITALQEPPSPAMVELQKRESEAYRKIEAQRRQHASAYAGALEDIYEKLRNGHPVAKGFVGSLSNSPNEIEIPAAHWRVIKFNNDYTEAKGQGMEYVGITVAKAK